MILDGSQVHAIRILDDTPSGENILRSCRSREDGVGHLHNVPFTKLPAGNLTVGMFDLESKLISGGTEPVSGSVVILVNPRHILCNGINRKGLRVSEHDLPFKRWSSTG